MMFPITRRCVPVWWRLAWGLESVPWWIWLPALLSFLLFPIGCILLVLVDLCTLRSAAVRRSWAAEYHYYAGPLLEHCPRCQREPRIQSQGDDWVIACPCSEHYVYSANYDYDTAAQDWNAHARAVKAHPSSHS